jgi:hypothetical protein
VGRAAELRSQLFCPAPELVVAAPLTAPDAVFASVPGLQRWEGEGTRYRLFVDDAVAVAPAAGVPKKRPRDGRADRISEPAASGGCMIPSS